MQVENTGDCSIVSKFSTSERGYFNDQFLKHFVSKSCRRAPLINRGYYVRMKAVDHVLTTFLNHFALPLVPTQIISFGAGFDTSYFRLFAAGKLEHCKYFEVDFPSVVECKAAIIGSVPELTSLLKKVSKTDSSVIHSVHYCLIGCDLRVLGRLEALLDLSGVDCSVPTLFLSDCVLTYIDVGSVNALLSWCARTFVDAVFCNYEQVHPDDGFGLVMQQHFQTFGSSLNNINSFPDRKIHEQRYRDMGWSESVSSDMNHFYATLPEAERQRVESLELFDEYEEWHLKCAHYMLLCAFNGRCTAIRSSVLSGEHSECGVAVRVELEFHPVQLDDDSATLTRFSHCSVQLPCGEILVVGGFGHVSGSDSHSRLKDILLLTPGNQWSCKVLPVTGSGPGPLVHHTATFLHSLNAVLIYGGRTSPAQANSVCFLLRLEGGSVKCTQINADPHSDVPAARWRHTATTFVLKGHTCVIIAGGCAPSNRALDDCYLLDTQNWKFVKLDVTFPEGRHSHCAVQYKDSIIILGGLNACMEPLSSCLQLSHEGTWKLCEMQFKPPLPPRYSMTGCVCDDTLWLLGGVSLRAAPDLMQVDLQQKTWIGYTVKPCVLGKPLLLHGHTCHCMDQKLVIIGGGGNCFSFGTHLNSAPCELSLPQI